MCIIFLSPFGNNIVMCRKFCIVCMNAFANIVIEWIFLHSLDAPRNIIICVKFVAAILEISQRTFTTNSFFYCYE